MGLDAGELNRRVTLKAPVYTKNTTSGEDVASWSTATTSLWVSIRPLRASEALVAEQKEGRMLWKIVGHPNTTVSPEMAFDDGSRTYQIISVQQSDKPNDRFEALCGETV